MIHERSNTPVDPSVLERVMARLSQRGPDGNDVRLAGQFALGHWHFWTTPEEVGEKQPLALDGLPFKIVLDGRLDNRAELLEQLKIAPTDGRQHSDAALILHAYDRWGEHCFEHFIGEFALVILDERRGELICARDALGDRTLFYTFYGTRLVIASEPWAVAGADGSAVRSNERATAHYFALKAPEDGQTLFENVYELLPAQVMVVTASTQRTWRYWQPDFSTRLHGRSNEEYAQQFRSLLEESVRCRLRSATPAGVLMSGGLDSTSVACLAAPMLAPLALTTISYVFDELAECDERQYIEAVKARWGINSIQIPCDDLWPFKNWANWPFNPNYPEGNLYRLLKERTYHRAQSEGLRVLLTGGFGDHLYSGAEDWLADLIAEGRVGEAVREVSLYLRYVGLRRTWRVGFLQSTARRKLDTIPGGRRLHRQRRVPAWLSPFAAGYLSRVDSSLDPANEPRSNLAGLETAQSSSSEIINASRHALELRHPYRDRRLVEFALTLPAYQLYYRGYYKLVLRAAMRGSLPEIIRGRRQPTSLVSLYSRGIEREKVTLQACFLNPEAGWRKFVKADWISKRWNIPLTPAQDGPEALAPWLCASYESWRQSSSLSN